MTSFEALKMQHALKPDALTVTFMPDAMIFRDGHGGDPLVCLKGDSQQLPTYAQYMAMSMHADEDGETFPLNATIEDAMTRDDM